MIGAELVAVALLAAGAAQPTHVSVGPIDYAITISPSAQVFYVVDEISQWSPFCHRQYARWAQRSLPPDESEERLLARHRELRKRHGWGEGLEQTFVTALPLDEAAAAGVKAGRLTQDEANTELAVLQHFAPRLQPLIDAEAPKLAAFRDTAARELPAQSEFVGKLARFVELQGTMSIPVYPMPDPSSDSWGGGFNGERLAIEVPSAGDPIPTLLHETFHALLETRRKDLNTAADDTPGLDRETMTEGLAYALMPGILHEGPSIRDELAEEVAEDRRTGKPWSDAYPRFRAVGLYWRDPLALALEQGTTLSTFVPMAIARFEELAPLSARRGLSHAPLDLEWLGTAGWRMSNGRVTVLVDPYLSRRPRASKPPGSDAPPPYGDEVLAPDLRAIDAHVTQADVILVTHAHSDHVLDVPAIAKKTGAMVVGTESVINIARAAGVPADHLVAVHGNEDLFVGGVWIRAVPSLHSRLTPSYFDDRVVPRVIKGPLHAKDYVEGGTLAYLVHLDSHRIYVQGSMNFAEASLSGIAPDIAIVGAADNREQVPGYTARLLRALGDPAVVVPSHVDDDTVSVEDAARDPKLTRTFQDFSQEVRAAEPEAQFVFPSWFKAIRVGRTSALPSR